MKTIVTAHDTYDFNELTQDAQEIVLNNLYDINTDYDWWDCEFEYWQEKLETLGFNNAKIYFSGFYSQGDGACFDADIEITETLFDSFVDSLINWPAQEQLHKMLKKHSAWFYDYLCNCCEFNLQNKGFSNHYSHENTREIIGRVAYDTITPGFLEQCFDLFVKYLEDKRHELCQDIFTALKQEYDYLTGREAIVETIACNEYTFLSNGEIFNN